VAGLQDAQEPGAGGPHRYEKPGEYTVVVKVIDIFSNDTTQQLTVDIQ